MGLVEKAQARLSKQYNSNAKKANATRKNRMNSVHRNMKNARNTNRFGNLKRTNMPARPSSPPPTKKKPAHCKFAYAAKNDPACKVGGKRRRRKKTKRRRTKRRRRTRRKRRR